MLGVLADFCAALREAGLPVSVGDEIDAADALDAVGLDDRRIARAALASTLVKAAVHEVVFATTFDLYFSSRSGGDRLIDAEGADLVDGRSGPTPEGRLSATDLDVARFSDLLAAALADGDLGKLAGLARLAVGAFAGIEPNRPVGVSYYLFRTVRALNLDAARAALLAAASGSGLDDETDDLAQRLAPLGDFGARLYAEELDARIAALLGMLEEEIRQRLVAQRGAAAVARGLRRPLLEEVDFMHASGEELAEMRRALYPLARVLATRLHRKRRQRRNGPLDFRATIRRSLSTGGVPLEPRFHVRHPGKPEIVVIADVSGSVASFARFTLHLVYALASQFSKVRTFVFVDGIDEVTRIFTEANSIEEAMTRVDAEADVAHLEGHSDYGHAFSVFAERYAGELTARTNVLILGDARNNYHPARAEVLGEVARRARHLYWLNPEPRSYWGSGDSIIAAYAPHCDGVFECRNLRQLEAFAAELA